MRSQSYPFKISMRSLIRKDKSKIKVNCKIFKNIEREVLRRLFMEESCKPIGKILRYKSIITKILLLR